MPFHRGYVRGALLLYTALALVWAFDEWQQGPPIYPGSWFDVGAGAEHNGLQLTLRRVRWDQERLQCDCCVRVDARNGMVNKGMPSLFTLRCLFHDLWKRPIEPAIAVGPFLFTDPVFTVDVPPGARYLSVCYRDEDRDLEWMTVPARLPRSPFHL